MKRKSSVSFYQRFNNPFCVISAPVLSGWRNLLGLLVVLNLIGLTAVYFSASGLI
jgi:hypothetical protein